MFVTKKHVSRRMFLRSAAGVAIGLPFLDAMVPALMAQSRTAAARTFRFGSFYVGNGLCPGLWEPTGEGAAFEASPMLKVTEAYRDQTVVVSGLGHDGLGAVHVTGQAMWLNGCPPVRTEGALIGSSATIDELIAAEFGKDTLLPSLQLSTEDMSSSVGSCDSGYSCLYLNTLSWRHETAPLPGIVNPRHAFERLFGETGTKDQRLRRLQDKRSILDAVTEETARLKSRVGARDRVRLNEYLDNVREVEQRIQRAEARSAADITVPDAPSGVPHSFVEHMNVQMDLAHLAFQADLTRVFSFIIGHELSDRTYPWIGVSAGHHGTSHHANDPNKLRDYAAINMHHMQLFEGFLAKLRNTPDGDGNLLDNSLLMYGAGMSNGNGHVRSDLPIGLFGGASGRIKGGRRLTHSGQPQLSNLLLTIGQKAGLNITEFGSSTGTVDL
jgi:hypothetical protein